MVGKPLLQRTFTFSAAALIGRLPARFHRAVKDACKAWDDTGLVCLIEYPDKLLLPVDLKFTFWDDGSLSIQTEAGLLDLGQLRATTSALWSKISGRPHLTSVLRYTLGVILTGKFADLKADTKLQFYYPFLTSVRNQVDETQRTELQARYKETAN